MLVGVTPRFYKVRLSPDVALVLSEWRERVEDGDWAGVPFTHKGELAALSQLGGALEKTLPELFDPRHADLVDAARDRLAAARFPEDE